MEYTLKGFDLNLAMTGFKCIMLTGSYAVGDIINEEEAEGILAIGTIRTDYSSRILLDIEEDRTVAFDKNGRCTTEGFTQYRLMMAGTPQNASDSGALGEIKNAIDALNGTIKAYLQQTENRIKALEDKADDFEQRIEDLENQ